jgi:hypothetical protein
VFEPLDFLAAVTQHIPDKGDHQRQLQSSSIRTLFIEKRQSDVVEKILRHCGLWMVAEPGRSKEPQPRPPPEEPETESFEACTEQGRSEPALDYGFISASSVRRFEREIS